MYRLLCMIILIMTTLSACGNTSVERTAEPTTLRIETAEVSEIAEDAVYFTTLADGNEWGWILEEGESFEYDTRYYITFDTLGTDDIYDDVIISIK